MRKTDKIANERFNGDIKEAIYYIMYEHSEEELETFYDEWTKKEFDIAKEVYVDALVLKYGYEDLQKMLKNGEQLTFTNEDILKAKLHHYSLISDDKVKEQSGYTVNHYRSNILKELLKFVIVNGCIIIIGVALQKIDLNIDFKKWAAYLTEIYTTCFALKLVPDIINYFRFKKTIKEKNSENEMYKL